MLENMEESITEYSPAYQLNLSVGIYKVDDLSFNVEEMYSRAVMAARECKKHPDRKFMLYTEELMEIVLKKQALINDRHIALAKKHFEVYLQPKV